MLVVLQWYFLAVFIVSEHQIAAKSVLCALSDVLSRVPDSSLLEQQDAPLLGLDVKIAFFFATQNSCRPSFNTVVS